MKEDSIQPLSETMSEPVSPPSIIETFKRRLHKLRHLKRHDIIHFIKHSRRPILYLAIGGIIVMMIIPIATYAYFVRDLSSKENIINKKNAGVILLDRNGKPFFTLFDANAKNPVTFKDIPKHTTQAFVAIEDREFYTHSGFSIRGLGRAVRENVTSESFAQGGSTITQQLIKNAILSADKQLLRKYQELVLAVELERRYSKDDILEMYLNTIYFGEGSFGLQDASQKYFSKDAKELTLGESALLAGLIQAPSALSPISGNLQAALKRKNLVLQEMQEQGYISEIVKKQAQAEKIQIHPSSTAINQEAVHFALMVQDMLIQEYGEQRVAQSGFEVKTTLDLDLQKKAQLAVENQVQKLTTSKVTNGAAVVIDPKTGQILALVGSHDWNDESNGRINMALHPRQPGSSFKPIIYAKALDDHIITTSTKIDDKPVKFGTYEPFNYDHKFRDSVLIRYALANSLNIPAVHVLDMLGVKKGVEFARTMGLTTLTDDADYGLSLVLGSAEVPLVEMTNAYATFANGGVWNEYSTFTEVRDKDGTSVLEKDKATRQVLSEGAAYLISSILSDNKARSDTFGGALNFSREAAVKTGTTNDYKDALTIGYTPQVVVGVWIGNNDNTPMTSIAGSLGAAPIWRQIMEAYLQGKPIESVQKPLTEIVDEKVCLEDGMKVEYATSSAFVEYFLRGTKPTALCGIPSPTPSESPSPTPGGDKPTDTPGPTTTPAELATATPIPTSAAIPTFSQPSATATPVSTTPSATPSPAVPTLGF
ncbi:hypothetical protein BH09PAT2_BH09PAT2_08200 [soil metagenome]